MNAIVFRTFLSAVLLLLVAGSGSVSGTSFFFRLGVVEGVKMKNATLEEALACVKGAALKQKGYENYPLNIVVLGVPDRSKRISLDLRDVSLERVLQEVARTFGLRMRIESYAVVLTAFPATEPIHTRMYRVPSDFISTGSAAK